ncbi:dTDP-4-dehydrorhamnose 3,5-epimerase [Bacillus pseudomycoides]|uniref:dTDP-4-dehydrorhamnose 3,5-epimerase n=1 Tax=Bacillus pseudomycoides TaxID=64104 RepID=A0AAJ1YVL0_9BACI|nr:dTDP-4-dehydrorhamnose 3,5-epimerase [Bacillus pseudomycoides]KFN13127.1 dTDP-4-dehydrorhamnose 3,5-epimerase [Bacillus pseudomycoides]MDR4190224.1 dTDP-4-dehydrorhamnose 3,5-epimerase [Bacillus pseudomycoides]MDR4324975.1 dTDP-4-dehydrorhamnose 3,5-epimerase [Bacillus pseudomycoides]MED0857167.1 dTDP-4-dehydrorhamnose 3,5-epimerase [Bacillus pseudomycoides]MED1538269.1 dTDP-4-dehydrorhamnose 3,5-epimerase [Bacillus pseudomycoides]
MKTIPASLSDVKFIEPSVFHDTRGYFKESYNEKVLRHLGIHHKFVQDNTSYSKEAGVIRGLHFQLEPRAQTKLVQVIQGAIFDVIVDLRKGSPTYKKWQSFLLTGDNHRLLLVPKGFAHGFCTLVPHTIVHYKVDEFYDASCDSGIAWDDEEFAISWPVSNPILSEKDGMLPKFTETTHYFQFKEILT